MENADILTSNSSVGVIAGVNRGSVCNSYVYNSTITPTFGGYVGGAIGSLNATGTVKNVYTADINITRAADTSGVVADGYSEESCIKIYTTYGESQAQIITAEELRSLSATLNENIESLGDGAYSQWQLSSGGLHPVFMTHGESSYAVIHAATVINGEANSEEAFISADEENYETEIYYDMYNGYAGIEFTAKPSDENYTFLGWYDNEEGRGEAVTKSEKLSIDSYPGEDKHYYAVYQGGPFILTLTTDGHGVAYGGENAESEIRVTRGSSVTVYADGNTGWAFAGWYKVDEETGEITGEALSTDRSFTCAYTVAPEGNMTLKAVFEEGLSIRLDFVDGQDSSYGNLFHIGGNAILLGEAFEVDATANAGYAFEGWYLDAEGTNLLSNDANYSKTISNHSELELTIYAKFKEADSPYAETTGADGIVMIKDPTQLATRVIYQYSGSVPYNWLGWTKFWRNGQGIDANGNAKSTWETGYNAEAYAWNGSSGYKSLSKDITSTGIILEYPGYYSFIIYDASGNIMNFQCIEVTEDDFSTETVFPSISKKYSTITFHDTQDNANEVYYQLTSTNTSAVSCPKVYESWAGFVKNGQETDVLPVNGSNGYKTLKAVDYSFDGLSIKVTTAGWYTFFYKFGVNQTKAVYILITQEDIEDGKGGVSSVKANYTMGTAAYAVISVKTPPVDDATKYAVKFTNKTTGASTIVDMYGTYQSTGKNYIVYSKSLSAGTKYLIQSLAYVNGEYIENGESYTFTTADATVASNVSGYYGNSASGICYTNNANGKLNMYGANGIRTTYGTGGWNLYRNSDSSTASLSESESVQIIPTLSIIKGTSGTEYVKLTYLLRNNTNATVNDYSIAIGADTQIGSLDSAPIERTDYGLQMSDNSGNVMALIANAESTVDGLYGKSTTATSMWFGRYSGHTSASNRYVNITSPVSGVDSAMIVAWAGMTLAPGEVKECSVIMGVVGSGVLVNQATIPEVSSTDGNFEIASNNTATAENIFTSVYYAYVSEYQDAAECPFTYNTTANNLNTLKAQGLQYKGVNGSTGIGEISGELIEEGTGQNNLVDYEEPGWYTFVFNYTSYVYTDATSKQIQSSERKCIAVNVKITDEDLYGHPQVRKSSNKLLALSNGANAISVVYQLSSLAVDEDFPYLYTDWGEYVKNGRGLNDTQNSEKYINANTSSGYQGTGFTDIVDGQSVVADRRTFTITTPGWYTVILKYIDDNGKTKSVYKYIKFTESDLAGISPDIEKTYSTITFKDNESKLKSAYYQLTSLDNINETAFLRAYAYGEGTNYTTVGQRLYKNSNYLTDLEVFKRIGLYASAEDYANGNMSNALMGINGEEGYTYFKTAPMDGASIRLDTPGWYTFILNYGDGYQAIKYAYISEADTQHVPLATVDPETGILTIDANGHTVSEAYVQWTCAYTDGDDAIPAASKFSTWHRYYTHGQSVTANDFNKEDGYKAVKIGTDTNSTGQLALYYSGWYTCFIRYEGGVQIQYVCLEADGDMPEIVQAVGDEEVNGTDNRYMLTYTDGMTGANIAKYAYGYIGNTQEAVENALAGKEGIYSWYGMTRACTGDITVVTEPVTPGVNGRTFNIVADKAGYYAVMVSDIYYGNHYYIASITNDVPLREESDEHVPNLYVEGNKVVSIGGDGAVYMKASSDETYTKGSELIITTGGNGTVDVIDSAGRNYRVAYVAQSDIVDRNLLGSLLETLDTCLTETTATDDVQYETITTPGTYTKQTAFDEVTAICEAAAEVYEDTESLQSDIDIEVLKVRAAIKQYQQNTRTIEDDLISVDGSTITVTIPEGKSFDYIIYCVEDYTDVETGYKPPLATIWKDWTGICSCDYYRIENLDSNNQYKLTNVPDGVYSFQIKVDGKIYYRNPIVSAQTGNKVAVAKPYLTSGDRTGTGYVGDAYRLLQQVVTYTDAKRTGATPYISDALYEQLESKMDEAIELGNSITEEDESRAAELVDEAAELRTLIRKAENAKVYSLEANETTITCEDASKGSFSSLNSNGQLTQMIVAKGEHSTWSSFAKMPYSQVHLEQNSNNTVGGEFEVSGDGVYTAYLKYRNGTYEFKTFTESGFAAYPFTAARVGNELVITIPEECAGSVENVSYVGFVSTKYDETNYIDITQSAENGEENSKVYTAQLLGITDHTVYVKMGEDEYLITVPLGNVPLVKIYSYSESGEALIGVLTQDKTCEWTAYALDNCNTWDDMLRAESGVRYISQNELVHITGSGEGDAITFYFKGKNSNPNYITQISGVGIVSATEITE